MARNAPPKKLASVLCQGLVFLLRRQRRCHLGANLTPPASVKATRCCHLDIGHLPWVHASSPRLRPPHAGVAGGTERTGGAPCAASGAGRARALGVRRVPDGRGRAPGGGQPDHALPALALLLFVGWCRRCLV